MCYAPIQILNPNYIKGGMKGQQSIRTNETKYSALHDTQFKYIYVPCGHCPACRAMAQSALIQRAREMSYTHHVIFCTATYSQEAVPVVSVGDYTYKYADIRDFQLMIKRIRKENLFRPFSYLCVTEFGGETHRPHFHYILFVEKQPDEDASTCIELACQWEQIFKTQWKRNISKSTKYPVWQPLSAFRRYYDRGRWRGTYDVSPVIPDDGVHEDSTGNDVVFYVTKYALKFDQWSKDLKSALFFNYDSETFKEVWTNKLRPRMLLSKHFGITQETADRIKSFIRMSMSNDASKGPQYFNNNGQSYPLARYYRKKYLSVSDTAFFIMAATDGFKPDGQSNVTDASKCFVTYDIPTLERKFSKFQKIVKQLNDGSELFVFDEE